MTPFIKDWLERIWKTALAAFVMAFVVPLTDLYSLAAWKGAAITAGMAAVTAIVNLVTKAIGPSKETGSVLDQSEFVNGTP
jgi:hypothetical protein